MSVPATIDRLDKDLQQVSSVPQTIFSYRIRNYNDYTIRVKLYDALIASIQPTTAPTLELDVPGFIEQLDDPTVDFEVGIAARCVTGAAHDDTVSPANPPQVELLLKEDGAGDNFNDSGRKPLVHSQAYIDVTFSKTQVSNQWKLTGSCISNIVDSTPLNLFVTTITSKTTTGFRAQLNGIPDSNNYRLDWAVVGITVDQNPATTYTLIGPSGGNVSVASTDFTVALPDNTSVVSPVTVTMHDSSDGALTPPSVILTTDESVATFTYTPASLGAKTISVTNNGSLTNPSSIVYTSIDPLVVHDTFTGSNDTGLPSHTLDTGGSWTRFSGASTNQMTIQSNKAQSFVDAGNAYFYWTESSNANGLIEQSAVLGSADSNHYAHVFFRYSDSNNYWLFRVNGSGTGNVELAKLVAGVETVVGSGNLSVTGGVAIPMSVTLNGTAISATAGSVTKTATDSFNQTATKIGTGTYQGIGSANTIDDFKLTI